MIVYQLVTDLRNISYGVKSDNMLRAFYKKEEAIEFGDKLWKSGKYDSLFLISWNDRRMTTEHSWYEWKIVKPRINYGIGETAEKKSLIYIVEIGHDYEPGEIVFVSTDKDKAVEFGEKLWGTIRVDWMVVRSYIVDCEKLDEKIIRSWNPEDDCRGGESCECDTCVRNVETVSSVGCSEDSKVSGSSCGYCGINCYGHTCEVYRYCYIPDAKISTRQ